jgi:hypothetical protein
VSSPEQKRSVEANGASDFRLSVLMFSLRCAGGNQFAMS